MKRLVPYVPEIVIVATAITIATVFAVVTIRHNGRFGLPLEDAYIYLTYAKQFGRAEPFTYFTGGGYSAGSTSVLWPMLLAPFWTLGARGHALVWVSFGMCTALYAASGVLCYRLTQLIAGRAAGLLAAGLALLIAPFAFTSLAGMEVAFASVLLLLSLLLLARTPATGAPSRKLVACLAALSLSRPECALLVVAILGVAIVKRVRQRELRAAAWWLAPLGPLVVWVTANRVFAGNWFPNTGVAKSHFYLPGFDWSYWLSAVWSQSGAAFERIVLGRGEGLLPIAPLFWLLWLVGAVRLVRWGWREGRRLVSVLIVASPIVLVLAVIGSSGQWAFHNFRYVAPGFPLLAICVACAFAPIKSSLQALVRARPIAIAAYGLVFGIASLGRLRDDVDLYAQNAVDLERQVVAIGVYVRDRLPDARIMLHDAGAISYYGDRPVFDMLGLVTNRQARVANHGPGARFEFLERMPVDQRPTHFAYYPSWMGNFEFYGETLLATPLGAQFSKRRLIGGGDMQLIVATWDHANSAERPLRAHPGWRIVDRVDVADLESEDAHRWRGRLGRRNYADVTARWSVFHKETSPVFGLIADGGRTIRDGGERFVVAIDPARPVKLVMRTGGARDYPFNEPIKNPAQLRITTISTVTATAPAPTGGVVDVEIDVPHGSDPELEVVVESPRPYRVFHWFVLQPE